MPGTMYVNGYSVIISTLLRRHTSVNVSEITCNPMFIQARMQTNNKEYIKPLNCWPYVRLIHPDRKVHGANMGPTWVLSAPDWPHVGPMYLAIRALLTGGFLSEWFSGARSIFMSCHYVQNKLGGNNIRHWNLHDLEEDMCTALVCFVLLWLGCPLLV